MGRPAPSSSGFSASSFVCRSLGMGMVVIVMGVWPLAALADDLPGDIIGVWDTGDGAHVEVYERDGVYHGRFARFYDEPPAGGVDAKNPDPALRDRPLLVPLIFDFFKKSFGHLGPPWT